MSGEKPVPRWTLIAFLLLISQLALNPHAFLVRHSIRTSNGRNASAPSRLLLSSTTSTAQPSPKRRFEQAKTTVGTLPESSASERKRLPNKYGADSIIASKHKERIKTAGRVGTKSFVDPCKVFVGNLPFDVDDKQLGNFVLTTMGQSRMVLHASKVVYDWKTGKSKGYGFVEFVDPIYATVCMDVVNGQTLQGRPVSVAQGKKKNQENLLYLKKKKAAAETDEEKAILSGLDEAEDDEEYEAEDLEIDEDGIAVFNDATSEDLEMDAVLFGLTADEDDDGEEDDGIFLERPSKYEVLDPNLNREQRREAGRKLKRKKLPHKGFG